MKFLRNLLFLSTIIVTGMFVSSCNDDKETDRFMVRYTAYVPNNAGNNKIKFIVFEGGVVKTDSVENVRGTWSREIGPVFRGFTAGINAGDQMVSYDVMIEVAENGGMYQQKVKGLAPKTFTIE